MNESTLMRSSSIKTLPACREHGSTENAPGGKLVCASISAINSELTGVYDAAYSDRPTACGSVGLGLGYKRALAVGTGRTVRTLQDERAARRNRRRDLVGLVV